MVTRSRRGYTLTEMLIAVAILGVLFSIGARLFVQINRFIILNRTRIELQREGRMILSTVNKNLRQAQQNSISISQQSNQPFYSKISFTRGDGMSYNFYQQGNKLYMVTSNSTKILTENLRYFVVAPPRSEDLSIISVSLTLEKAIYDARTKALHMASEKVMIMN
jgi:prepilin-type N-terminal cleavage/methylation domain-containing protein